MSNCMVLVRGPTCGTRWVCELPFQREDVVLRAWVYWVDQGDERESVRQEFEKGQRIQRVVQHQGFMGCKVKILKKTRSKIPRSFGYSCRAGIRKGV
jgi:hypothetical protein